MKNLPIKALLGFCLLALSEFTFAQITTNCLQESGVTTCKAVESGVNVMNMKCNSHESGISCGGDYTDKTTSQLQMDCQHTESRVTCRGHDSDNTKFQLSCLNNGSGLLKCNISDNQGESLMALCKLDAHGLPNCSAVDNDNQSHKINCSTTGNNQRSCITD